jgi:hypothetical protein
MVRYGIATNQGSSVERGLRLCRTLDFTSGFLGTTDVISGAAGAIPVLLAIGEWTGSPPPREYAIILGTSSINSATRWPFGWSWSSAVTTNMRDLTGLAHGAAGFGHAFVELYAAMRDNVFKYAAEQAFAYEDAFFNPTIRNWPDFRSAVLSELMSSDERRTELAHRLQRREAPPNNQPSYVRAWCHGAPGIGLTRLRAFDVLGKRFRHASRIAVGTTAAASQQISNYSLCHGAFGNDATLIEASRVLGDPQWASQALARAELAADRYELGGRPWPSGALGNIPDPSLMLGDAGIGYHLLRVVDPRVPSILLPIGTESPESANAPTSPAASDQTAQRREHVRAFFACSMEATRRLLGDQAGSVPPDVDRPVLAFAESTRMLGDSHDVEQADLIADVSTVELSRLQMIMSITDMTDTLLDDLGRVPPSEVDWQSVRLSLSPFARVVAQQYDWDAWLAAAPTADPPPPADAPIHVLLHRRAGSVTARRLNRLSAAVLSDLGGAVTMNDLCRGVRSKMKTSVPDTELDRLVLQVIINAYGAGIVAVTNAR